MGQNTFKSQTPGDRPRAASFFGMVSAGILLAHCQPEKANRQTSCFFTVACSMSCDQCMRQQQQLDCCRGDREEGLSVAETALQNSNIGVGVSPF
jgi:hypothetical protein